MARARKYDHICKLLLFRRVFVGSTTRDLWDVRAELAQYLGGLGYKVLMFDWGEMKPQPGISPPDQCVRNVADADMFVLVLGSRWGYEMPDGRSATEAEYDAAVSIGLPRFVFARRYVWDFVQAVRRVGEEVRENGPLQKEKAREIVRFYQKVADSMQGKVADFVTLFDSSVDLKLFVARQLEEHVEKCFATALTQTSLRAFAGVLHIPIKGSLAQSLRDLHAMGYEAIGTLAEAVREKRDFRPKDIWDLVAALAVGERQAQKQPAKVICIDKRVVTSHDFYMWKSLLDREPSAGHDVVDLEHFFARLPGHVWSSMHRLLELTAQRSDTVRAFGDDGYQSELSTLVQFLWHEYVREELSQMENVGQSKCLRFWATDTAFEDLSPGVWTTEDFHIALLNSTIKIAQQHSSIEYRAVRLSLVRSPGSLLAGDAFAQVYRFFKMHAEGGVTCGIVPTCRIKGDFAGLFRDFYLVPKRVLYRLLRRSSIHIVTTCEDEEGRIVLRQYEQFYEHLLSIAVFIDARSLPDLRGILKDLSEASG